MSEIEFKKRKSIEQVEESTELAPKFDKDGLIPVVTTDFDSGEVLMQRYMNQEAFIQTIKTDSYTHLRPNDTRGKILSRHLV